MPDYLNVVLLGIIEGITEFLPISSTGHLLIAEHWLGQRSDLFNITIQAGAMLAVMIVYRARLRELLLHVGRPENRLFGMKIATAFLITAVLGLAVKKLGFSLPTTIQPVAYALIIGGLWILAAEWWASRQPPCTNVTWFGAAAVGASQIVAGIFPGTSRSAATIFAAMFSGTTDRAAATEFAFLVGIPTMFAASAYELYGQSKIGFSGEDWPMLGLGFVVSMVVALISVTWLLTFIRSHDFRVFAYYRIGLGVLLLGLVLLPDIRGILVA